jgi:hypothetical protein
MKPNLIERLEQLVYMLEEARVETEKLDIAGDSHDALSHIDNASGVAGELLTMIDGR